ncbi:hypothetical protein L1D14_20525 [Vibrio tubiashii]|uniref:hypothetical protein n=1 Tax=Vibrio tubiashii TaxID=29498 RepID=UPI001EFD7C16|nr:hypothetical protein [Vibrio tubiashii]MCG9578607.1 hypothetical protein [Vibrio tubiashii]
MQENTLLDAMLDPSILHWLAMMFGQWVYGLSATDHPIEHPVSAFMVVLASLSVCAVIAFVLVCSFIGGRAIVSTGATAKVASQTSPYIAFRVIAALMIIMPSTYGMSELDQYNVSVSHGQVGVISGSMWGGGVADIMFQLGGKSLLKYNVSGNPPIDNTVSKSNLLAKAFVCNEFYYRNIGESSGKQLINYRVRSSSTESHVAFTGVKSLSEVAYPDVSKLKAPAELLIFLGGDKGYCGEFSFTFEPSVVERGESMLSTLSKTLYGGLSEARILGRNTAQIEFAKALSIYEVFAARYYSMFSGINANLISETAISEVGTSEIDSSKVVNSGALQSSNASTLEDKIAATTDALHYLAIYLSYKQSEISSSASNAVYSELTGVKEKGGSLDGFSEKLFEQQLKDYISAGMFWSVYHNISDVMYETSRKINSFSLSNTDIEESRLCQDTNILQVGWNKVSNLFGDERFLCQSVQHVQEGFNVILSHGLTKAKTTLPKSITMGNGSQSISQSLWSGYFASTDNSSAISGAEIDWPLEFLIDMIDSVWSLSLWFGSDDSVVGGGLPTDRSLISGSDALMLDMNGTTSPFSLLTQLGQQTRDIALITKGALLAYEALVRTLDTKLEATAHSVFGNPIFAPFSFLSTAMLYFGYLGFGIIETVVSVLTTLYTTLITSSLAITYGIPLIPVIGWVFVIIGVFFAIGAAAAAINFAAILMALPKGDGVFAPDTERILGLVFGIFIRQALIVTGFLFHLVLAFAGLSLLNLIWVGTFINKFDNLTLLDGIFWVFAFFIGYIISAFFICLYSFKVIGKTVDAIGIWFATHLVGGAFGSNSDDIQSATNGFTQLSGKLDDLAKQFEPKQTNRPNPSNQGQSTTGSNGGHNPRSNDFDKVNA